MSILKQKRLFNGGRSTRHSARFESSTSNLFKLCHFTRSARKIRFQRQSSFDHDVSDDLEESTVNLLVPEDKSLEKEIPKDQGLSKRGRGMLRWEPSNFTGEELISLETAFTKMDSDGNGTLSGVGNIFRIFAPSPCNLLQFVGRGEIVPEGNDARR